MMTMPTFKAYIADLKQQNKSKQEAWGMDISVHAIFMGYMAYISDKQPKKEEDDDVIYGNQLFLHAMVQMKVIMDNYQAIVASMAIPEADSIQENGLDAYQEKIVPMITTWLGKVDKAAYQQLCKDLHKNRGRGEELFMGLLSMIVLGYSGFIFYLAIHDDKLGFIAAALILLVMGGGLMAGIIKASMTPPQNMDVIHPKIEAYTYQQCRDYDDALITVSVPEKPERLDNRDIRNIELKRSSLTQFSKDVYEGPAKVETSARALATSVEVVREDETQSGVQAVVDLTQKMVNFRYGQQYTNRKDYIGLKETQRLKKEGYGFALNKA